VPVLLRSERAGEAFYADTGTLLTIHNLGYQGIFPMAAAQALGLDPGLLTMDGLEYYGQMSFLKGGAVFADAVNTVSATYCLEIQTPEMGLGFEGILRARNKTLFGVLNGIDDRCWDPQHDPVLAASYSVADPDGKAVNKRLLQKELGLAADPEAPLLAMVTRLATQKGLDLVTQAWSELLARKLQIVLLGTGDQHYMDHFAALRDACPERVSINLSFDDALARHIYAGSDLFLMPSHYEPCGLGQLIALRYGSVPVVRKTGGLADTVFDPAEEPRRANGFCFRERTAAALLAALDRALALYRDAAAWRRLVRVGMGQDFSWRRSAGRYVELYALAREARNV
jgi:starch synthase